MFSRPLMSASDLTLALGTSSFAFVATDIGTVLMDPKVLTALVGLVSVLVSLGFNLYKFRRAPSDDETEKFVAGMSRLVEQLTAAESKSRSHATQQNIAAARDLAVEIQAPFSDASVVLVANTPANAKAIQSTQSV